MRNDGTPIYELSINARVAWQAHSMSNIGSGGSNRLFPRRQLLADGTETDACSGNIEKHHHAAILAEYLDDAGQQLCPACARRDSRRAAALATVPCMEEILECGMCDIHGFLIPAKSAGDGAMGRQRRAKHTLLDFSFALALPGHFSESPQLFTRMGDDTGDGQMVMKATARSGEYALCIRYKCAGVGFDTNIWQMVIQDEAVRLVRHKAVLEALRDLLLSPTGALTAKMLPHLTGLTGVIIYRTRAGRASMYSPLEPDFADQLQAIALRQGEECLRFKDVNEFSQQMEFLIGNTCPYTLGRRQLASNGVLHDSRQ